MKCQPPVDAEIALKIASSEASIQRQISRSRRRGVALVASVGVGVVTLAGGTAAAAGVFNGAHVEFMTKPQYLEQFAECMTEKGWEPIAGSTDPAAPVGTRTVHFDVWNWETKQASEDASACRESISAEVGESIIPD